MFLSKHFRRRIPERACNAARPERVHMVDPQQREVVATFRSCRYPVRKMHHHLLAAFVGRNVLCQSEIGEDEVALFVEEDIVGFDVAVDYAFFVKAVDGNDLEMGT